MFITGNLVTLQNGVLERIQELGPLMTNHEVSFYRYEVVTVEVQAGKRIDSPEVVMDFVADFLFSTNPIFILGAHNPIFQKGEVHFIEINDVNTLIQAATDIIMRNFMDRSSREKVNLISYLLNDLRERVYQFNPPIKEDINQKISLVSDPYYDLIVDHGKLNRMVEEWEDGHKN